MLYSGILCPHMSALHAPSGLLDQADVLILTWNEASNIARTLDALSRFPRVVILDSGSTDSTMEIAARYPNVRVCTRAFDNHAAQWNHGLVACGLRAPWVLALDADYVLSPELVDEIACLEPHAQVGGYQAGFKYCINGRALSGSLYPPVGVLYRRQGAEYVQDGHTQRITFAGQTEQLRNNILHDDRKPVSAWLAAQDRYAKLECELLLSMRWAQLRWRDRLRRLTFITPWLVPLYCLTAKRGLLDGRAGLFYALQRGIAESLLSVRLLEAQFLLPHSK